MEIDPAELARREKIIVDDEGEITAPFEVFYLESIVYAAGRADQAFERFDSAVRDHLGDEEIVATVQEALAHAAALSRFFWPSRQKSVAPARAQKLRNAFGLTENSAIGDRKLRDGLEHFDERLDRYLLDDHAGYFFPSAMVGSASLADDQLGHIFKLVDPTTETFVLLGQKHDFGALRKEVRLVLDEARRMSNEGGRIQPGA